MDLYLQFQASEERIHYYLLDLIQMISMVDMSASQGRVELDCSIEQNISVPLKDKVDMNEQTNKC